MEGVLLVGAAALAGGSASLLLWGGGAPGHGAIERAARRALRAVRGLLLRCGRMSAVSALLELAPLGRLSLRVAQTGWAAGLGLDVQGACAALVLGVAIAGLAAGVLFASPLAGVVAAMALTAGMLAWDSSSRRRKKDEIAKEMPGIYRTLSVAMGSGQTLAQAVEYVGSHERGPAAGVFARMSLRLRCGISTEEAVQKLVEELDAPGVDLLATALVISHRTGSPLRELLLRSARLVERQGEFERLLTVKTAQVRLSVRIVCLLPVVMIFLLALISPDFQKGLLTPAGMGCVLLALLLDGTALLIIRRLVRGVL